MYMYIHVYTYICLYTYVYINKYTYVYICIHIYIYVLLRNLRMHVRECVWNKQIIYERIYMFVCKHESKSAHA